MHMEVILQSQPNSSTTLRTNDQVSATALKLRSCGRSPEK